MEYSKTLWTQLLEYFCLIANIAVCFIFVFSLFLLLEVHIIVMVMEQSDIRLFLQSEGESILSNTIQE